MNPYNHHQLTDNSFRRIFGIDTHDHELVWHRDRNARLVKVIEGQGWKFQHDNGIPITMNPGDTIEIPAEQYHRIIKGSGQLIVEIIEHDTGLS